MRHVAIQSARELYLVVGVHARIVLPAGHGHVRQPLVLELLARTFGLDVHEDAASGLSLAAVTRHGVPVIKMPSFASIK